MKFPRFVGICYSFFLEMTYELFKISSRTDIFRDGVAGTNDFAHNSFLEGLETLGFILAKSIFPEATVDLTISSTILSSGVTHSIHFSGC